MSLLHSALVQVLSNSPAESRSSNRFGWTIKKPESLRGGLGIPPQTCALPGLGLLSLNRLLSLLKVWGCHGVRSSEHLYVRSRGPFRTASTTIHRGLARMSTRTQHTQKTASRGALLAAGQIFWVW